MNVDAGMIVFRSAPTGQEILVGSLSQDCAALVLGYFHLLPTGAEARIPQQRASILPKRLMQLPYI